MGQSWSCAGEPGAGQCRWTGPSAFGESGREMPEISGYTHGVPSWVDLSTPDLAASVNFYGSLFDWVCQDQGEQAGHYTMALKGGKLVGALMPVQRADQPA